MNTLASNPARAWPTSWGKEAVKWCKEKLIHAKVHRTPFADKRTFVTLCMAETNGMINPKVPSDVWDDEHAQS